MEIFKKLFLRNLITLTIDILAAYFKQGPCPNARELAFHAVTTNQSMSDRQSKDRRSSFCDRIAIGDCHLAKRSW